MTKSSKQILLVAVIVAVIASTFIYYANSSALPEPNQSPTNGTEVIEETDRTDTEEEELSMNDETDIYGPLPQRPVATDTMAETVACLKEKGVVIYGSRTCPACAQMVTLFKGYEVIDPIYVECQTNGLRCSVEMQTQYVPEVQISGSLFQGPATPAAIAAAVGCPV